MVAVNNARRQCKLFFIQQINVHSIFLIGTTNSSSCYFYLKSKFSTRKLVGPKMTTFRYNGCTTDSGGGGTGDSLYYHMEKMNLCAPDEKYLVGFCCLHTLQLTLCNALEQTIGFGGLGKRNAMQAIHSFYDLQDVMEFGLWKMEWTQAAKEVGYGDADVLIVHKLAAPIVTRWWTVGEAAKCIVLHLPVFIQIAKNVCTRLASSAAANKIASSILSLVAEPIIVSDIKLIACYHNIFLNEHFNWFQKGDPKIGGTPGYLARHLLVRYYLMWSDLEKLKNNGWKRSAKLFVNSLEDDAMKQTMIDPSDALGEKVITFKAFQTEKANKFFEFAQRSITKHYQKYCEEKLFLSLYGESCGSQLVAQLLQNANFDISEGIYFHSKVHNRKISMRNFKQFLRARINVDDQKNNIHVAKCNDIFPLLQRK